LHFPPGLITDLDAAPSECGRPWKNNPTLPALFHNQPSKMAQPFVLNRLRQQPCRQLSGSAGSERTGSKPVLQLGGMTPAVPLGEQIFVETVSNLGVVWVGLRTVDRGSGIKWRVMVELTGSDGIVRLQRSAQAAATQANARLQWSA
jgi:hypothetical protein